ncbi:transposase, partial [Vibrio cholerae]
GGNCVNKLNAVDLVSSEPLATTTTLKVKRVLSIPLRALQGFIEFANVPILWTHYSCISRRAKPIEVSFKLKISGALQHLAIGMRALKAYGEGDRRSRSVILRGKCRVWRKLHLTHSRNLRGIE